MKYLTPLLNPLTNTFKLITLHNKSTHLFNSTFLNKCSEWIVIFVLLLIIQSHTRENIQTFLKVLQNALIFWSIFLFTRANIKTSLKVLQNALKRHWTTSASSPIFFQKSWDFYTIRRIYLYVINACTFLLATSIQLQRYVDFSFISHFKKSTSKNTNIVVYGTLWGWC